MTDTLIQSLQNPDLYDHPVQGFSVIETHISWIILTGEYAYKIKKPVDFGFLDFSTLELRHKYCLEEVRLNSRYAPDLYLDVLGIRGSADSPSFDGRGEPFEYVVKMRQFPGEQLLSRISERGELDLWHVEAMAEEIAAFHQSAAVSQAGDRFGSPAMVQEWAGENFEEMRPLLRGEAARERLDRLEAWTDEQNSRLKERFQARKADGFVRECHGDLHLGNMFAEGARIRLFDCIEFNEELRWIDVMCEVAFVFMDLCDRGRADLAQRFLNLYLQHTGDYGGLPVLPYYVVYRALVRAKVILLRLQQGHLGDADKSEIQEACRSYLELAVRTCEQPAPLLVITHGLSGSGKSWLAAPLADALGAVHIRSDIERKRLHGYAMDAATDSSVQQGIYTQRATRATYCHMALVAADCLDAGYPTLIDATFLKRWQRDQMRTLAGDVGAAFVILELRAPEELLRRRVAERARTGEDVSEADATVLENQLSQREPLGDAEQPYVIPVDSGGEMDVESLRTAVAQHRPGRA